MVVSATIDQGPVMIYFGQEVGEPGAGAEGFAGKDGRTTIFDYWGVPEHQKWMNGGAFDGGLLGEDQKKLRQFYASLLNIAQKNPAIVNGSYKSISKSDDIHAFIRISGDERLLIVSNFDKKPTQLKLVLSADDAASLKLQTGSSYMAKDILWNEKEFKIENQTITTDLPSYSSFIFKITN